MVGIGATVSVCWKSATAAPYSATASAELRSSPKREISAERESDILNGGYWWREPGPNCELVIAYQGVVADQALAAAGRLADARRDVGVLAITSADRLYAGLNAARRARADRTDPAALSHSERLLAPVPRHAVLLTVIDGHPATLSWIGGVRGMRTLSHGVEHFGQTGSIGDLYRHFRLDTPSLVEAVLSRPID